MAGDLIVEGDETTDAATDGVVDESGDPIPALELPEEPDEAIAFLAGELLAARAAAAGAVDQWKRAVAEFDNYRKRSQRDQTALVARSSERVLRGLLPVLDSLDAAMAMESSTGSDESMRQGLTGTRDLLLAALAKEGMEPIQALGTVFDPNRHEAAHIAEGSGTMVVTAEWRRGYMLKGRVIRATLVAVGYEVGAPERPEESEEEAGVAG